MDERKLRLKQLKKACKKAKRKYVTLWKTLGILFLVFAILLSIGAAVVKLFDNTMADMTGDSFWGMILATMQEAYHQALYTLANSPTLNGVGSGTTNVHALPLFATLLTAAAVLWVLYLIMLVLWLRGKKKWKRSEAYLDYKTLKSTIKQEKQK